MQMQCWEDGPAAARMQRELSYRRSIGSGRAMGSSTGCNNAEDVERGGLASHNLTIIEVYVDDIIFGSIDDKLSK